MRVTTLRSVGYIMACSQLILCSEGNESAAPEAVQHALLRLLDLLVKLDNLKDMKASVQSDFSRYKRAFGARISPENLEEITVLQVLKKDYLILSVFLCPSHCLLSLPLLTNTHVYT